MINPSQPDMDDLLQVTEIHQKEQRVLSRLLGELRHRANRHLVLHVRMGDVSSYLTSVTLGWVAERVGFAADLPIFHECREGFKRVPVDSETVEKLQQRQPDWRRQLQMAAYLAMRRHHKFPPLLLVGYQRWIYEARHERWGTDAGAMNDSLTLRGLEPTGTYWDLDDTETEFYAFDGQHRLMAILGLRELIRAGQLHAVDERRNPKRGDGLSREEIVEHIHSGTGESRADIHERLQHLMDERIGIEIVPAVCMGDTYGGAMRRLLQMFVDVNESAKTLSRSEIAQRDETNGYRVVSRRLSATHDLLRSSIAKGGEERPRVDPARTNLPEASDCYTTLNTLAETVERYLKENRALPESSTYVAWGKLVAKGVFVRPEDPALEQGTQAMAEYFDHLATIPSHIAFIQGKPASEIRKPGDGDDNILFRPMVQTALAEAIGKLMTRGAVSLKTAVEELGRQEQRGQLRLTERTAPWFGVLCDPSGKPRRHKRYENLCCRLFQYLLGGGLEDDEDRETLRGNFAHERRIDPERDLAIDLEGNAVSTAEVRLPNPWR